MRNKKYLRSALSLLLAAMLLTGCGGERRGTAEPTEENREPAQGNTASAVAVGDWSLAHDNVISSHTEHNARLKDKKEPRKATKFSLFVENTEALTGFVPPNSSTDYVESIQAIFDSVNREYETVGNYLTRPAGADKSDNLTWVSVDMNDNFKYELLTNQFYDKNVLPNPGPLAQLFRDGATPFEENSLSLIVSNFAEPGFNLTPLSKGIELYFDSYEKSAACVIGVSSDFHGEYDNRAGAFSGASMVIPNNDDRYSESTFYIRDYNGKAPFYMVLVGPESDVISFSETFFRYLDNAGVVYSSSLYSNTVYEQIVEHPLEFDMVADPKVKKAPSGILSSFNTGVAQKNDDGTAFTATYAGVETRDGRFKEDGRSGRGGDDEDIAPISVTTATQLALLSKNFSSEAQYTMDYKLHVYDTASKTWQDAGKNAQEMVSVTMDERIGELVDEIGKDSYVILANGRKEIYLSTLLDFSETSTLSRDKMYRLEIQLHLCRDNPEPQSGINTELERFSVSNVKYYEEISKLCNLTKPNKQYRFTEAEFASRSLPYTPNLTSFLLSLENLEGKFQPNDDIVEYVDLVFNVGGNTSER